MALGIGKMTTAKVFDCQEMPENIRKIFFDRYGRSANDVFVSVWVLEAGKPESEDTGTEIIGEYMTSLGRYIKNRGDYPVQDWLFDNGANESEEVLVRHWW